MRAKRFVLASVLVVFLLIPANAQAVVDIGVSQVASANLVPAGSTVTYTVTVRNEGETTPFDEHTTIELVGFEPGGEGAVPNPYLSVTTNLGFCIFGQIGQYHDAQCDLGVMSAGATAEIVATVQLNESMDHLIGLFNPVCFGLRGSCGYADQDDSDNSSELLTIASVAPVISGSSKIKFKGLPEGCATGDFTVTAKAKGDVDKLKAQLVSAKQNEGVRDGLGKTNGKRLTFTVPVGELKPASFYEIRIVPKPGPKAIATFQRC